MNMRLQSKTTDVPSHVPLNRGWLQRKCECGTHTIAGGECASCERDKASAQLQRVAFNAEQVDEVPPIVHEVLRSPGQPLDADARSFFEPRFGHDFSRVRIHSDQSSARSAQAINALAYTVGNHVVFSQGPNRIAEDRDLLAHELAHVVQQNNNLVRKGGLTIGDKDDPAEREADAAAVAVTNHRTAAINSLRGSLVQRQLPTATTHRVTPIPAATGSFGVNMKVISGGLEGTIEFTPDAKNCPQCKLIRLAQIVRVFEKPGQDYVWPGTEANREKVKTKEDKTKGIKPNFFVDHFAAKCSEGHKCSIYYRDHAPNAALSQDGSNDGVTPKKASLYDGPSGDAEDVNEFETCARCHDTGTYLRCVHWGYSVDKAGKATASATSEQASPSATFTAAISAFDKFYKN